MVSGDISQNGFERQQSNWNHPHYVRSLGVITEILKQTPNLWSATNWNVAGFMRNPHQVVYAARLFAPPTKKGSGFIPSLTRLQKYDGGCLSLLAGANCARQTAVVHSVIVVPQRLPEFNSLSKNFDLLLRTSWSICWQKFHVHNWIEILIVSILQNRFKNVLTKIAH